MFTNSDIAELTAFRRELHLWPELSGAEEETANPMENALTPMPQARPTRC